MIYNPSNYDPSKVDFSKLPETLKDASDLLSGFTSGFKDLTILKDQAAKEMSDVFFEKLNLALKATATKPEVKPEKKPSPTKKKAVARSVKAVPKVFKTVPKVVKPAKKADKPEKVKRVAKASKEQVIKKNKAQYLKESEEILTREIGEKEKVDAIKIINTARQINVLRSMRSLMRDMPAVHKKRLAPTKENLELWAKNPGRYDMIGVDAPGGIGDITIRKSEQEIVNAVKKEVGLTYDYIEELDKTLEALNLTEKNVKTEVKATKKRLKK